MENFNEFLHKVNLLELEFVGVGPKYTWTNCREAWAIIRTRIDRAHANSDWPNIFLKTKVIHLPHLHFDHCSILLKTLPNYNRGIKPFRFEPFWMNHHSSIPLTIRV